MLKLVEENVNQEEDPLVDRHQYIVCFDSKPTRSASTLMSVVTLVSRKAKKPTKRYFVQRIDQAYFERLNALFQKESISYIFSLTFASSATWGDFLCMNVLTSLSIAIAFFCVHQKGQ